MSHETVRGSMNAIRLKKPERLFSLWREDRRPNSGCWRMNRAIRVWTQMLIRRLQDQIRSLETEFKNLHLWIDPDIDPTAKRADEA